MLTQKPPSLNCFLARPITPGATGKNRMLAFSNFQKVSQVRVSSNLDRRNVALSIRS